MIQSRRFFGRLFGPLIKPGLPLTKNVLARVTRSVFIGVTGSKLGQVRIRGFWAW